MKFPLKKIFGCFLILLSALIPLAQSYAAEKDAVFIDITSQDPHFDAIQYLYDKGIVEGYPDHSFRPKRELNRAETVKMILLSADILTPEIAKQEIFPDVLDDAWYAKYVRKAKNLGIVKGDADTGFFRPGDTVNLAETVKMVLLAHQIQPDPIRRDPYNDVPKDVWFAPYFAFAKSHGLLEGDGTKKIYPSKPVNRGMLADILYHLLSTPQGKVNTYASFYGDEFQGKGTASGEPFDQNKFTAAHRTYPFGTTLRVTNVDNEKSVIVKVNDRGPYAGKNRVIDLSRAAFLVIAEEGNGVIPVTIEEVSPEDILLPEQEGGNTDLLKADLFSGNAACPDASQPVSIIDPNSFEGIQLKTLLPQKLLLNEIFEIRGTTKVPTDKINLLLLDDQDQQTAFEGIVEKEAFVIRVKLPHAGHFRLGMIPGTEGGSIVRDIDVLESGCVQETVDPLLPPPASASLSVKEGDLNIAWNPAGYNLFKISLIQNSNIQSYLVKEIHDWKPPYADFKNFKNGKVTLLIRGADIKEQVIFKNLPIRWSQPYIRDFEATQHFDYKIDSSKIKLLYLSPFVVVNEPIKTTFEPKTDLQEEAAFILPEGTIQRVLLKAKNISSSKNNKSILFFPAGSYTLNIAFDATEAETYFLEINDTGGLAAINLPVYAKDHFPLIPSFLDLNQRKVTDLGSNTEILRGQMLNLINQDRQSQKLSPLVLDKGLNDLAQVRVEDMAAKNYFGHWDEKGAGAEELKGNFGIKTAVSENLAKEVTLEFAEYGLMRSAIHRENIFNPEWARLGVGIKKNQDGSYLFAQIFSPNPIDSGNIQPLREQILKTLNKIRQIPLAANDSMNALAQQWSASMVEESFFGWTSPKGVNLLNEIRKIEPVKKIGAYIVENSSFYSGLSQLLMNTQIKEDSWNLLGVGLSQDAIGLIKITLVYSE
ncbi:septal ring lytic transglycosylase RlpA family protein [Candidatus Peregrinibacteria bacterium]|nr:septal ring lytic transglycosylase RlpA family protein [Candidatus Peregrinibacteria bacterium]